MSTAVAESAWCVVVPHHARGARQARHRLANALAGAIPPALLADVISVAGELVANAVRHGKAPIRIRVARHADRVRIEVRDHGGGHPAIREVQHIGADAGGWGLRFVSRLADAWGTHTVGGLTSVWLERLLPSSR